MAQTAYRYYCLDGAGHLDEADWFEAEGDADAMAQVKAKRPGSTCEIWQGTR